MEAIPGWLRWRVLILHPGKRRWPSKNKRFKDVFPIKHGDFPASHFRGDNQLLSFEDEANMIDIDIVPTPTSGSTWVLLKNMHTLSHFWLVVCPRTTSKKDKKSIYKLLCYDLGGFSPPKKLNPKIFGDKPCLTVCSSLKIFKENGAKFLDRQKTFRSPNSRKGKRSEKKKKKHIPETNSRSPLKTGHPKGKSHLPTSNHCFLDMLVSGEGRDTAIFQWTHGRKGSSNIQLPKPPGPPLGTHQPPESYSFVSVAATDQKAFPPAYGS